MVHNRVGAVVISRRGRPLGIVTDRDLALRCVAKNLPPAEVEVAELMSPDPLCVDIDQTEDQAAALMHALHVRRLVVLDQGRVAGIVTLDDLVLSRAVDPERVRDVVFAQLADEAPGKPAGFTHPRGRVRDPAVWQRRREARRQQTLRRFSRRLMALTGLGDAEQALVAFEVVASALAHRLTPREAQHFAAQLPKDLRAYVTGLARGPDRGVTRESIEAALAIRLDIGSERARELATSIGGAIAELVSPGEIEDMRAQLPRSLRSLLTRGAERLGSRTDPG